MLPRTCWTGWNFRSLRDTDHLVFAPEVPFCPDQRNRQSQKAGCRPETCRHGGAQLQLPETTNSKLQPRQLEDTRNAVAYGLLPEHTVDKDVQNTQTGRRLTSPMKALNPRSGPERVKHSDLSLEAERELCEGSKMGLNHQRRTTLQDAAAAGALVRTRAKSRQEPTPSSRCIGPVSNGGCKHEPHFARQTKACQRGEVYQGLPPHPATDTPQRDGRPPSATERQHYSDRSTQTKILHKCWFGNGGECQRAP